VTTLEAVATFLPDERVPIEALADQLELSPIKVEVFRRHLRFGEIRLDRTGTVLDLLLGAVANLDALRGREHRVRYVFHARSYPVGTPYPCNPLHDLCRMFGLQHAVACTVTGQACASGLLAIDLAGRLLAAEPDADEPDEEPLALVLAGEKAFTREAQISPDASIFGEGAAACLVGRSGPRDRMLSYAASLHGEFDSEDPEVAARFQRDYPMLLAEAIRAAVAKAGLGMDEISLILPHNVNRIAWQRVCRQLGFPIARVVLDNLPTTGHVFCADTFFNYLTARGRDLLHPGDRYVVSAAGAARGATLSAMVFEH